MPKTVRSIVDELRDTYVSIYREARARPAELPEITPMQIAVLLYIDHYITNIGYAPKLREINAYIGATNVSAAFHHVKNLDRKGFVRREPYQVRGLTITDLGRECLDRAFGVR